MPRVLSDLCGLAGKTAGSGKIVLCPAPSGGKGILAAVRTYLRSFGCDYMVLNWDARRSLLIGMLHALCPINRCRLVSLDLILTRPEGRWARLRSLIIRLALSRVHRFLVYARNTRGYAEHYGLRPSRFDFVPYKVDALEHIRRCSVRDEGYVFAGGISRRDFRTFCEAIAPLGVPGRIVTLDAARLADHGTTLPDELPENVELVPHDGSVEGFVELMSRARLVVVPLLPNLITQAGIAVYLMAMALGKCVVISRGPGVEDVLRDDEAIMVPAGDTARLRRAIRRAWNDRDFRERVAACGRAHALRLGGEERLLESVRGWVDADLTGRVMPDPVDPRDESRRTRRPWDALQT